MKTFLVEFKVADEWIEDGFDLDDDKAKEMIENALPFSRSEETEARVIG